MWLVQALSLSRLLGGLIFASLAFQDFPLALIASIYAVAAASDLVDGALARRLRAESHFGRVLDLVSDKSLTIVSLLYASARGVDVLPLSLIAVRELIMLGGRIIVVDGRQLLPTNRLFGGVMSAIVWGNTLALIMSGICHRGAGFVVQATFWMCATLLTSNLVLRVYASRLRIRTALAST